MMKINILYISCFTICTLMIACEPEPSDSVQIAAKLEGKWQCDEFSSGYKAADDFYNVDIEIYPTDSNKIVINNFYQLGNNVSITVNVIEMSLEIPSQTTKEGSTIYGSGVVSSNFNKINWNYSVDIGDGLIDDVTATYTRIDY